MAQSWGANVTDPMLLCELKTRADAYGALAETTFEGWAHINGDDPRSE